MREARMCFKALMFILDMGEIFFVAREEIEGEGKKIERQGAPFSHLKKQGQTVQELKAQFRLMNAGFKQEVCALEENAVAVILVGVFKFRP